MTTTTPTPTATLSATTDAELDAVFAAAAAARGPLAALGIDGRRRALDAAAAALRDAAEALIPIAREETHLPEGRLRGEIERTAFQLELYGQAASTAFRVDHDPADAAADPAPRPELYRSHRPIGVVLNFAASNFPFAFSVAGTDTASALAAGCPVVVKTHSGHPRLSVATWQVVAPVLEAHGCPPGTLALIAGTQAGIRALQDPRVGAAAFTGSLKGGRALFDIACARPTPIPFYGELGSVNPAVVAPHAAATRGDEIAAGFFASFTLGAGQYCTKPGLLFWPESVPVPDSLLSAVRDASLHELLNERITAGFEDTSTALENHPGVSILSRSEAGASRALLLATDAASVLADPASIVECFGPAALVIRYRDGAELVDALGTVEGSLTGTIHADDEDDAIVRRVLGVMEDRVGRIVWDDWPTGVAVAVGQQHGGPYPAATSSLHTSVGTHAIDRFLRPIAYQNVPERFLPVP
ncbi:aldehyde dehydrogenase family protein [Microbacterium rhizosphaerae]|uniref:Aldehyde dehydrogenase family protein n=1 Tax=Microbacterium rhizosphaerae TaxID=1678237 RepID=A0ABZ0SIX8_9MICO|nr:aldehyde dehydrogenase family protein [Microbacterium rhizosphaerae]WPR89324.1 aldehyde dehydrogenase family protein [Microbacterium rhizosphaerae]